MTSATAASNASALAADGWVIPLTLRTYWRAAAAISWAVAGGSSPRSSVIFRHMVSTISAVPPLATVRAMTDEILLIDTDERVRTLTLNRPQSRNALSAALRDQFFGALADAEHR